MGGTFLHTSGALRRGNANVYPHVIASEASNPFHRTKKEWIASLRRNDGIELIAQLLEKLNQEPQ